VTNRKNLLIAAGFAATLITLVATERSLEANAREDFVNAPRFEVDPMWPKPLPNKWVLGNVIGVGVDARDHVFIVHRSDTPTAQELAAQQTPPTGECCIAAPPVIEFDPAGNVVNAWGGPPADKSYVWPTSNHGIGVDDQGNIWIGGNGGGNPTTGQGPDSHILKFTHDGKYLATIGVPGQPTNSASTTSFGRVAKISFDFKAQEAYAADGYANHRVAVLDMKTGAMKRFWGAYSNVPSDSNFGPYNPDAPLIKQFRTPVHCAEPSNDGLVYVCDRPNDRIQVFQKDGKFVKEKQIAPRTLGDGSIWDIAFSTDPAQKYMFVADGKNERVYVLDRASLEVLTSFGEGGRQPGQWFAVHSMAADSKGNLITTETYEGKRVQKFLYKGIGRVTRANQGTLWPARP
jgi:DNA-binding beta-propeller fold protein YncE